MDVNLETLEISEAYLSVINALSCVVEKDAWIFASKVDDVDSPSGKRIKRDNNGTNSVEVVNFRDSNTHSAFIGDGEKRV